MRCKEVSEAPQQSSQACRLGHETDLQHTHTSVDKETWSESFKRLTWHLKCQWPPQVWGRDLSCDECRISLTWLTACAEISRDAIALANETSVNLRGPSHRPDVSRTATCRHRNTHMTCQCDMEHSKVPFGAWDSFAALDCQQNCRAAARDAARQCVPPCDSPRNMRGLGSSCGQTNRGRGSWDCLAGAQGIMRGFFASGDSGCGSTVHRSEART